MTDDFITETQVRITYKEREQSEQKGRDWALLPYDLLLISLTSPYTRETCVTTFGLRRKKERTKWGKVMPQRFCMPAALLRPLLFPHPLLNNTTSPMQKETETNRPKNFARIHNVAQLEHWGRNSSVCDSIPFSSRYNRLWVCRLKYIKMRRSCVK